MRDGEERWITPGDCGLNQWREWEEFLETGRATVVGWEPGIGLEGDGTVVRIWCPTRSMGTIAQIFVPQEDAIGVEMHRDRFASFLRDVEADLRGFLGRLDAWARRHAPRWADALVARFDHAFAITSRRSPEETGPVPSALLELHATLDHLRVPPIVVLPYDPWRPSSPDELRRGGRHCPLCLFPLAVSRRPRPCPACGAHRADGASCRHCGSEGVWEGGADAACVGCGVHGPKQDVLS